MRPVVSLFGMPCSTGEGVEHAGASPSEFLKAAELPIAVSGGALGKLPEGIGGNAEDVG